MTINQEKLMALKAIPITDLAQRLGLHVVGDICICPFHTEQQPSLHFNRQKNTFKCFGCNVSGDTISLVMRMLKRDFKEACVWLAESHCMDISEPRLPIQRAVKPQTFDAAKYGGFFSNPRLSDEARRFLYEERKIDPRVARYCRLNSFRHLIQIPYYDEQGRLVGMQNRNLTDKGPRFTFPKGSQCQIYNMQIVPRLADGDMLGLAEGTSDCWAMMSDHIKAIAIPSATLLKDLHKEYLRSIAQRYKVTFHMWPDCDEPGELLYLKVKEVIPDLVHHRLPEGCKDYAEYHVKQQLGR